jgi:hypothetical protein
MSVTPEITIVQEAGVQVVRALEPGSVWIVEEGTPESSDGKLATYIWTRLLDSFTVPRRLADGARHQHWASKKKPAYEGRLVGSLADPSLG